MFTQDELRNLFNLISVAPITGRDATIVVGLQNKIKELMAKEPEVKE